MMNICGLHPNPTELETLGSGPSNLCFKKPSRWLCFSLQFGNHWLQHIFQRVVSLVLIDNSWTLKCNFWMSQERAARVENNWSILVSSTSIQELLRLAIRFYAIPVFSKLGNKRDMISFEMIESVWNRHGTEAIISASIDIH